MYVYVYVYVCMYMYIYMYMYVYYYLFTFKCINGTFFLKIILGTYIMLYLSASLK